MSSRVWYSHGLPHMGTCQKTPDTNIVRCQWTFTVKRDNLGAINKYKLRLVAQGFTQVEGLDYTETFSPTICFMAIRLILMIACRDNLELWHINIKGAYLNGRLEDDVYMHQPKGFITKGQEHLVCKLNKGIYGLKQSRHVWHQTLKHGLEKLGFRAGEADTTIFFQSDGSSTEIAGWYVNDGLLAADSTKSMERMVRDIRGSFDIQDLGELERFLGIKIRCDRDTSMIHLSWLAFINTIVKQFNISIAKIAKSLMDINIDLQKTTTDKNRIDTPYSSLIGSINYCAITTRLDISYAMNKCAQFTSKPSLVHWEVAKRIVQYLLQTCNHGITFRKEERGTEGYRHLLTGYTDADFARDSNDRKSTSGWVFTFSDSPI